MPVTENKETSVQEIMEFEEILHRIFIKQTMIINKLMKVTDIEKEE